MNKFIIALCLVVFSTVRADNQPAVSLAFTQNAVDNMKNAFVNFLISKVKAIPIPDFHYKNVDFSNL